MVYEFRMRIYDVRFIDLLVYPISLHIPKLIVFFYHQILETIDITTFQGYRGIRTISLQITFIDKK